jgi:hypothetical protein
MNISPFSTSCKRKILIFRGVRKELPAEVHTTNNFVDEIKSTASLFVNYGFPNAATSHTGLTKSLPGKIDETKFKKLVQQNDHLLLTVDGVGKSTRQRLPGPPVGKSRKLEKTTGNG